MTDTTQLTGEPKPSRPIRVLVVDDSGFMRFSISRYLGEHPEIQIVGTASDGKEALRLIPTLHPDVVTLDIEMAGLDGLSTLRRIMTDFPLPVIMLSSLTREGTAETIKALSLGAVDVVAKPDNRLNIQKVMDETAAKIIHASQAKVKPIIPQIRFSVLPPKEKLQKTIRPRQNNEPIVMIGTSTGGPRALNEVLPALSANLPAPVVVVQHMPVGFTHSLAERLDSISRLSVKEAEPGDTLNVGQVLIAPGGFHTTLDDNQRIALTTTPPVHGVRPSVDVTMISLIQQYGKSVIGIILTGMGKDGTNGAILLHSMGGQIITEHQSSCVVWGMPRSVFEAGVADVIVPLPEIASAIDTAVNKHIHKR